MTKFILIRHGCSIYNKERRFTGQADIELNETGLEQAECAGRYIVQNFKVDSVYSSDLKRAVNTAEPVANALNLPVNTKADLREIDVGQWQDVLISDVIEKFHEEYQNYLDNPGVCRLGIDGENYSDVIKRAIRAISEIAEENEGKTVVVATHGGVIRALICAWTETDIKDIKSIPLISNTSITVAEYDNGKVKLLQTGYNDYLNIKTAEKPME